MCTVNWLYWNSGTWSSSDVIVTLVTSSCNLASQHHFELTNINAEFSGKQENNPLLNV